MTLPIFMDWLVDLNRKMIVDNRKILLILDNAPVHPVNIEYFNIEILYLPPRTTLKIQPMDRGIIRSFKANYKRLLIREICFTMSDDLDGLQAIKNVNLVSAILLLAEAWKSVTNETINNCFCNIF